MKEVEKKKEIFREITRPGGKCWGHGEKMKQNHQFRLEGKARKTTSGLCLLAQGGGGCFPNARYVLAYETAAKKPQNRIAKETVNRFELGEGGRRGQSPN